MSNLDKALEKALERVPSSRTETQKTQKSVSEQPANVVRSRGGHMKSVTPFTKRITLDLRPEQDRALAIWAVQHGSNKAATLRALVNLLLDDEDKTVQQATVHQLERGNER